MTISKLHIYRSVINCCIIHVCKIQPWQALNFSVYLEICSRFQYSRVEHILQQIQT